jgi:hypothetical protein
LNLPSGLGEGIVFSILSKLEYNIVPGFQATPKTQTFSLYEIPATLGSNRPSGFREED